MADLAFPRVLYRGEADTLGSGQVGETTRVDSPDELDAALKDGWRLTRELEPTDDAKSDDGVKSKAKK
jgi:hypothetical protein